MTKIEKIQDLLEGVETDLRNSLIKDILDTLKDFAKDGVPEDEKPGMQAAIEIIAENFSIRK